MEKDEKIVKQLAEKWQYVQDSLGRIQGNSWNLKFSLVEDLFFRRIQCSRLRKFGRNKGNTFVIFSLTKLNFFSIIRLERM